MVNHLAILRLESSKTPTVKGSSPASSIPKITTVLYYQSKLVNKIDPTTSFVYNPTNFNLTIRFAGVAV